ncbi:hypothetical protein CFN78_16080 [Amycolatopsis antarctica]|uniref:ABC transporter permease n=1 Tax=Amycolatopsis antarctica TaxID=1854586 RepID=A0A263D3Y7_9PSEU|nr:iron chelate uptake ABC transporter family permease subunit [Amycolatopsis antarctica]OZM72065.1 hypothetical protein CFN78_16080 [Amycolatopsis antarctica]
MTTVARTAARGRRRAVLAGQALLVILLVLALLSMSVGRLGLSPGEVLAALTGNGPVRDQKVITGLRLPRTLTAVLVGAGLAISGALMQSLTRNALGSPDFVGITAGATTGALLAIIGGGSAMADVSLGAFAGGMGTALVIYLLVFRRGLHGFRLVLVGIGVSAMLFAFNDFLISRASIYDALAAQAWRTGSLNLRDWEHVLIMGGALVLLLPVALYHARRLSLLEMHDEVAAGLGVPVHRTRLLLLLVSVALAAVATALTGPIAFVALAAPHLARRLAGASGPGIVPSALMGAVLLVVGDVMVQQFFPGTQLPVGIATGSIGGLYLIWLLGGEWLRRKASGWVSARRTVG